MAGQSLGLVFGLHVSMQEHVQEELAGLIRCLKYKKHVQYIDTGFFAFAASLQTDSLFLLPLSSVSDILIVFAHYIVS